MARITADSLRSQHPFLAAILDGDFDGAMMENVEHAIAIRKRTMFRPGTKVRLVGTKNVEIDGKVGTVIRVGPKRISVGLGEKDAFGYPDSYNVPPRMLEVIQP
jgi:hypothetical protein